MWRVADTDSGTGLDEQSSQDTSNDQVGDAYVTFSKFGNGLWGRGMISGYAKHFSQGTPVVLQGLIKEAAKGTTVLLSRPA